MNISLTRMFLTIATILPLAACGASSSQAGQSSASARITHCRQIPKSVISRALAQAPGAHAVASLSSVNCTWSTDQFTLEVVANTPPNEEAGYTLGGSPCPGASGSLTGNNPSGHPISTLIAECGAGGVFLHASPTASPDLAITPQQKRAVIIIANDLAH